ncbi:MAG: flavodoxin family protein [Lachnospiraceae bacterium]|nr:flavodoxin family protein [Lachnospiraceae bacterium]
MKVLMLNGSPKAGGNTGMALQEMKKVFIENGIDVDLITVGNQAVRGCVGCGGCAASGKCVTDDIVNDLTERLKEADGVVVGSPVYYASANATLVAVLDRLFTCNQTDLRMKVGASVVVARRGGCSATFDELNKYFTISGMPVASSCYWNSVHGAAPGDAAGDAEGLQTVRELARNMIFMMKSFALGREAFGLPEKEDKIKTNFIR